MVRVSGAVGLFGNAQSSLTRHFLPAHRLRRSLNSKVERPVVGRLDGRARRLGPTHKAGISRYDDFAASGGTASDLMRPARAGGACRGKE